MTDSDVLKLALRALDSPWDRMPGGGDEEVSHQLSTPQHLGMNPFYSIDAWR